MGQDRRPGAGKTLYERPDDRGQSDFAEIAEREAGDGNANLHTGNDSTQVADEVFDDFGAGVALFDQLADTRKPDGDQRKFRRREKRVHADQENDAEDW